MQYLIFVFKTTLYFSVSCPARITMKMSTFISHKKIIRVSVLLAEMDSFLLRFRNEVAAMAPKTINTRLIVIWLKYQTHIPCLVYR